MSSFKLKVLLCGAAAVGKTSLVQRFIKNRFAANYKLTVGVDILTKDVEFRPSEVATLSIWDIGGQQRFEFIRSTFYKGPPLYPGVRFQTCPVCRSLKSKNGQY